MTIAALSTQAPSCRMSLWKKIATPSGGTDAITRAAASENHRAQPANPRRGSSETSGSEVITLAPASGACSRNQGRASP